MKQGTLYVVATPIGNLDDITARAVDILRKVDLIACEDTRKSRVLLQRWDISTHLISLHRFSETRRTRTILERLGRGDNVAIISDAGTPAISDPGSRLVKSAIEAGFLVAPIPGASSIIAALSVSGMDCSSFSYLGFVPKKREQKKTFFENLRDEERTAIFFETAKRIQTSLRVAAEIVGSRRLVILRELTKLHEEMLWGTATSLLETLGGKELLKGEITVVVEAAQSSRIEVNRDEAVNMLITEGFSGKRLAEEAHSRFGLSKTAAYKRYLELKKSIRH